jgi:hypothetical protein
MGLVLVLVVATNYWYLEMWHAPTSEVTTN